MRADSVVSQKEEIERLLAHGLAPITDNVDALLELGFSRAYHSPRNGYEAALYERSIDHGYRETRAGLRRVMVCQRAFVKV